MFTPDSCQGPRFCSSNKHSVINEQLSNTATIQCESKKSPEVFCHFFPKRWGIFSPNFTRLLRVPIYARLQICIPLTVTWTTLWHIKCDHPVHIICSKCPPSAETHTFRRLLKSLIAKVNAACYYVASLLSILVDDCKR